MVPSNSRQPPRSAQNTASAAQTAPLGNANTQVPPRSDTLARRAQVRSGRKAARARRVQHNSPQTRVRTHFSISP